MEQPEGQRPVPARELQQRLSQQSPSSFARLAMGDLLSAGLLGAALLLLLLLAVLRLGRHRQPYEPPLDKGLVPWFGHALGFGKDAFKFLSEMREKHGDIYTIQVVGKFVTVLLDPHSYDAVLWESTSRLDFGKYARILMDRMFDVRLPDYDQTDEKNILKMTLQNKNLPTLTKAMFFNLQNILLSDPTRANRQWKEEGLFHLCYSTMFRAGFLTLYGNEDKNYEDPSSQAKDRAYSLKVCNAFFKLDRLLMKAARSMLSAAQKKEFSSIKKELWVLLSVKRSNNRMNRSLWLDSYRQHLEELGVDEDMQTRAMVLQLWSTQGNAGPAVFWLLFFLLKQPSAMAAVQTEMANIFKASKQKIGLVQGTSQEILNCTPIFDSALNEALRLTAAPFISREVLQDMSLKLADGKEYRLRKGDRLCLFPFISPQMDPDIYEDPETFRYDRFMNSDGTEKTDFYKRGEKLKYYTMPWGAGINVCVGKFFATNSIKQCVFLLLSYFDLELKDPNVKFPGFDKERYGFGMMQPEHDIIIRYKVKDQ